MLVITLEVLLPLLVHVEMLKGELVSFEENILVTFFPR